MKSAIREVLPFAYSEVVELWKNQDFNSDQANPLFLNPAVLFFLNQAPFISFVLDLRTQRFLFFSNNSKDLFGYESNSFIEGGLAFKNQIIHQEDLENKWKLKKKFWNFILTVPSDLREQYKFTLDYRIVKPNGEEVRVLEQVLSLHQDTYGNVKYILGNCIDITGWKRNGEQCAYLTSSVGHSVLSFTAEKEKGDSAKVLSKREAEIVKLLSQGFSSKYIADKLHISFNTVNTHRQHIIKKTHTKNTGELIRYATSCGLI